MTTTQDQIAKLAPTPESFEPEWSRDTLATILAEGPSPSRRNRPWWRATRRRAVALIAAGVVTLGAGTAVAGGGPVDVVKDALLDFSKQPNTTANGFGRLHDPELVAKFRTKNGIFAFWVATSSSGQVCYAESNGTWDGGGLPTKSHLAYGCGGELVDRTDPDQTQDLTRPDQLGGFFKDSDGPLVYGISPYPDAVSVRVQGPGLNRTLPIRTDSHGFGSAIPEASHDTAITVTFLDDAGRALGPEPTRWVAPVG
jgi:hypothetical protein